MKIKLLIITFFAALTGSVFAQSQQYIPYQAVARNVSGDLIANQTVALRFSIHDGSAGGTVVYKETQTATTNKLGLFNASIGGGTVVAGTYSAIAWGGAAKFIQVEIDPAGGSSYINMGTSQIQSVPYALVAGSSAPTGLAGGDLAGSYPNPSLASIGVSAGTYNSVTINVKGQVTAGAVINADWTASGGATQILNKPTFALVATSGNYNDLSNRPTIPAAQVNADWAALSGIAQIFNKPALATVATTGNYNDLTGRPTIPAGQVNSDWNASSGLAQILNKPTIAAGVPVASVFYMATVSVPSGYLECNGAAVSRSTYSSLFAAIGGTYGAGNGSTTFNLPDLRGQFVRGYDNGRGLDAGRAMGSSQAATGISNQVYQTVILYSDNIDGPLYGSVVWDSAPGANHTNRTVQYFKVRPTNVALMPCIKY